MAARCARDDPGQMYKNGPAVMAGLFGAARRKARRVRYDEIL